MNSGYIKRKEFLEMFLQVFGADHILWTDQSETSISGTVIFDTDDPEERQDFIWHMEENNVPNDKLKLLLMYLKENQLIDGDKLLVPASEIKIPGLDLETKERLLDELFNVTVNMIDEGQETDCFYIHD